LAFTKSYPAFCASAVITSVALFHLQFYGAMQVIFLKKLHLRMTNNIVWRRRVKSH